MALNKMVSEKLYLLFLCRSSKDYFCLYSFFHAIHVIEKISNEKLTEVLFQNIGLKAKFESHNLQIFFLQILNHLYTFDQP